MYRFLFVAIIMMPAISHAGIVTLHAHRSVTALLTNEFTEPLPLGNQRQSSQLGWFDATAEAHISNDLGDHSDLTNSQKSFIANGVISATGGFFESSSDDLLAFHNTIDLSFRVTQPTRYHLAADFAFDQFQFPGFFGPFLEVTLRDQSRNVELVSQLFNNDLDTLVRPLKVRSTGPLVPGDYQLHFELQDRVNGPENIGRYQFEFAAGKAQPNAVPLPPAAVAGSFTLAGLALSRWWSKRRRAMR
jgi:hypothetical protein